MPEMQFSVRWPDSTETTHYSPSLVVESHLTPHSAYAIPDFLAPPPPAREPARQRVRARFGFPCSRALSARDDIARRAAGFTDGQVTVLDFHRL